METVLANICKDIVDVAVEGSSSKPSYVEKLGYTGNIGERLKNIRFSSAENGKKAKDTDNNFEDLVRTMLEHKISMACPEKTIDAKQEEWKNTGGLNYIIPPTPDRKLTSGRFQPDIFLPDCVNGNTIIELKKICAEPFSASVIKCPYIFQNPNPGSGLDSAKLESKVFGDAMIYENSRKEKFITRYQEGQIALDIARLCNFGNHYDSRYIIGFVQNNGSCKHGQKPTTTASNLTKAVKTVVEMVQQNFLMPGFSDGYGRVFGQLCNESDPNQPLQCFLSPNPKSTFRVQYCNQLGFENGIYSPSPPTGNVPDLMVIMLKIIP